MPDVPTITPAEVNRLCGPEWMLLDVRTDAEWDNARIGGSVHIPLDQLMSRVDEVSDKVICVCAVGVRSAQATAYLKATGREAFSLDGGIHAWSACSCPVSR